MSGSWSKHWSQIRTDISTIAAAISGTATKRMIVVLCGTQTDGTITPLKCDSNGQLITKAGA